MLPSRASRASFRADQNEPSRCGARALADHVHIRPPHPSIDRRRDADKVVHLASDDVLRAGVDVTFTAAGGGVGAEVEGTTSAAALNLVNCWQQWG